MSTTIQKYVVRLDVPNMMLEGNSGATASREHRAGIVNESDIKLEYEV